MDKQTVKDIDVSGKQVLLRAALNVPIKDGKVTDERRLKASLPTIQYLVQQGAKVILMSHHSTDGQSLAPVAPVLTELLGQPIAFVGDCLSEAAKNAISEMTDGTVVLLENLRFHVEEEANDNGFAKALARLGEIYVDDDFTTMHREHASVVGVPKLLPAVAGFLVETEVETITSALENPKRPLLAIIGGAKISTKVPIIYNLLPKVQAVFIGGAMANTFMAAEGLAIGESLSEADQIETAKKVMADAKAKNVQLFLPIDVVVTDNVDTATNVRTINAIDVGDADIIVDIGPESVKQLAPVLAEKGTVIWNGPVGITEISAFAAGSKLVAEAIIESGVTSLVGGGDTSGFLDEAGLADKFSFVSTGGGASLDLMSGKKLPGIEALSDKSAG